MPKLRDCNYGGKHLAAASSVPFLIHLCQFSRHRKFVLTSGHSFRHREFVHAELVAPTLEYGYLLLLDRPVEVAA